MDDTAEHVAAANATEEASQGDVNEVEDEEEAAASEALDVAGASIEENESIAETMAKQVGGREGEREREGGKGAACGSAYVFMVWCIEMKERTNTNTTPHTHSLSLLSRHPL